MHQSKHNAKPISVIQARMSSSRLPGKVLRDVAGVRMLELMLARVTRESSIPTVVATSVEASDDPVAALCRELNVDVVRGPLENVLGRFIAVVDIYDPDAILRLTGDNPFTDARAVREGLAHFEAWDADAPGDLAGISNHLEDRRDPHGYAVEVLRTERLRWLDRQELTAAEREHVTLGFINRDIYDSYQLLPGDQRDIRWTVDYPEDLTYMDALFSELGHDARAEEAIDWSRSHPHPRLD